MPEKTKPARFRFYSATMKIKEDLAGQYYDQVRPIMTTDGTVNADHAEKIPRPGAQGSHAQGAAVRGEDLSTIHWRGRSAPISMPQDGNRGGKGLRFSSDKPEL